MLLGEPRAAATLPAAPNVTLSAFWLAAPNTVCFTVRSSGVAGFVALESSLTGPDGVSPAGYFSTNLFMQARAPSRLDAFVCGDVKGLPWTSAERAPTASRHPAS